MGDNDEVMRFEITDQDPEDEMTTSCFGMKRMSKNTLGSGQIIVIVRDRLSLKLALGAIGGRETFKTIIRFVSGGIVGQK